MIKFKREDHPDVAGGWVWSSNEINWINQEIEAAVLVEREACAKYFDDQSDIPFYGRHVATAIRARSEK